MFCLDGRVAGLDGFDHEETLRQHLPHLLRSYALDALGGRADVAKASSRREVEKVLEEIAQAAWFVRPAAGLGDWAHLLVSQACERSR